MLGRISWFVSSSYSGNYFRASNRVDWLVNGSNKNHILYGYYIDSNTSYSYDTDSFSIGGADNGSTYGASNWFFVVPSNQSSFLYDASISANGVVTTQLTGYMYMPQDLTNYIPPQYFSFIYDIGYNQFNFGNTDNILNTIETDIRQSNTKLNSIDNGVSNIDDFLTDDTIDNYTSQDLPQNTVTDITQDGFNSIFTKLYDKMTATGFNSVHIPLTIHGNDMSFDVNTNSFDFYKSNRQLVDFIQLIWSFVIYYYIIQDVYKLINELSQGKFASYVDNIKTTLL